MTRLRLAAALCLLAIPATPVRAAGVIIVQPGYGSSPLSGSPYRPTAPFTSAMGGYPPGAQTCVAENQMCPASAPNTVGNRCECRGRDGRPAPGIVH